MHPKHRGACMQQQVNTAGGQTRTYLGIAWLAGALLYTVYAGYTSSGLFERACDWQDHIFGAHDTTAAFLGTLILCSLPAFLIAPDFQKRGEHPAAAAAPAFPDPVKQERILAVLGGGCLLAGIVAGGGAFRAGHRTPVVVNIDLLRGEETRDVSHADQLVVNGMQQMDEAAVLTTTRNGSESSEMFIPFTGEGWDAHQPIQYVLREEIQPHTLQEREQNRPLRFGPAAIFRHALPGEVRTDWQRRGLTLSPSLIVLDQNLSRRNETAWVVCFFGVLGGIVFLGMGVYVTRRLAAASSRKPTISF